MRTPWRYRWHYRKFAERDNDTGVTRRPPRHAARRADPAGDRLRRALDNDTRILGLELDDRGTILRALEDPSSGLEDFAVLLAEHVGRKRDGPV